MPSPESSLLRVQLRIPKSTVLGQHLSSSANARLQLLELATLGLGLLSSGGARLPATREPEGHRPLEASSGEPSKPMPSKPPVAPQPINAIGQLSGADLDALEALGGGT